MNAALHHPAIFMDPMRCLSVAQLPEGEGWQYEIKWEGHRAIGCKSGRHPSLFSSGGGLLDREFPELQRDLTRLYCRSAVVDGVIVALGRDGRPCFQRGHVPSGGASGFVAIDLLALDGRDLRELPLNIRLDTLMKILPSPNASRLCLSQELQGTPDRLLEKARELQIGGIVAKRRYSPYESGQGHGDWVERPLELRETFFIGGYVADGAGFDEALLGEWRNGQFRFVARVRSGLDQPIKQAVMHVVEAYGEGRCPFSDFQDAGEVSEFTGGDDARLRMCRWVRPKVAVEVAFLERAGTQKLRHPRCVGMA